MDLSLNIDGEYCLEKGLKFIHFYLLVPCEHWFYTNESSFENNGIPGLKCFRVNSAGLLIFEILPNNENFFHWRISLGNLGAIAFGNFKMKYLNW